MKKLVGIVVVAVVIATLCAPALLGRHAQGHIEQVVQSIDEYPGYTASITRYQRSWLTSNAEVEIGIDWGQFTSTTEADVPPMALGVMVSLDHGPLLLNDGFGLGLYQWRAGLDSATQAKVNEALGLDDSEPFYRVSGKTSLLANTDFKDTLRAFELQDSDFSAAFTGYKGAGNVSSSGQLTYVGAVQEASFTDETSSASMADLEAHVNADLSRIDWSTMLYPSDALLTVGQIQVRPPFGAGGLATGVRMASSVSFNEQANAFDMTAEMSVNAIAGEAINLSDAVFAMSLLNIDIDAYRAYMEAYGELLQTSAASADAADPVMPDYSQLFTPQITQAFWARGPEVHIDQLSFTLTQGTANADLSLGLSAATDNPPVDPQMLTPWLLNALTLNANLALDRSLADHFGQLMAVMQGAEPDDGSNPGAALVDMFVEQGMLTETAGKISADIEMQKGVLEINEQPFPLGL
ncbi:YdgA family protein [Gilvimarinus agarilyticus]|uniref:DUF945 family protein n=1 Tax=Gilvimarinus sp. 2_MG-2023 TaxID=3062666 RepID=UPI001C0A26F5|nr:DUF945 family protein [Gilvimarinus sp. 2_MG-2023]MBU2884297.1 YdgA family protein [Gilvimarinus agarilyticus]MDO6569435.1 DUF945 family protein [Gilvimarinus sp. 2_MG-2023]